ncbi:Lrp/AsnC family transcriptional regulator [Sphingobium sp.]|uniref:Lrp/AsnC family transcriptional regulator n=1 Tax=Sphingobium sp. TaxID=1912891 RepID=UPI0028BE1F6A|nr:Lrp/AsnC family transcriptional regulator [Sphingobium sp.]
MNTDIKIDSIDVRILNVLQRDASLSMQQIGEEVGLSANPCWRRIKRLEDLGIIQRRAAIIDTARLGLGMTCFVSIRTNRHSKDWLDSFAKGILMIPEIVECHRMTGDVDYLLKIVIADIAHYDRVYRRLIATVPELADVSSTFSMERLKNETAIDLSSISRRVSGVSVE